MKDEGGWNKKSAEGIASQRLITDCCTIGLSPSTLDRPFLELISERLRFDLGVKGVDSRPHETITTTE